MHFDLPDFKRCCLCVPLRHGILIFGYLNLFFALFVIGMQIWIDMTMAVTYGILFRGVGMDAHKSFSYLLYTMEVVFNIVLLVGAHRKSIRVILVYYYYGITTTLAAFLTAIVLRCIDTPSRDRYLSPLLLYLAFIGLALQCYLLLVIRSELKKLQYQGGQCHYVNNKPGVIVEIPPPGELGNPLL